MSTKVQVIFELDTKFVLPTTGKGFNRPYESLCLFLAGTQSGTFLPFFIFIPSLMYPFQQGLLDTFFFLSDFVFTIP